MAKSVSSKKPAPAKGVRITKGSKWRLTDHGGKHRQFSATVIESWSAGGKRIVLLSVPTRPKEQRSRKS